MKRLLPLSLLTLAACGNDPAPIETTALLPTSDIVLGVSVQANGEAAVVSVSVSSTDGVRELADSDQLVASAEDAAGQELTKYDAFRYAVLLPTKASRVTLALVRPAEQAKVDIDLPAPFALTVPSAPVTTMDPIPLSWEPGTMGDAMTIQVSGPCISPLSRPLASDTGSYELQPGDLSFTDGGCTVSIALSRSRPQGPLGLGASGSFMNVAEVRTAALEIVQ